MPKFEGCIEAKEISLTRKGANQHAHVLIRKNADPSGGPQPKPENNIMSVALTDAEKAAAAQTAAVSKAARGIANKIAAMSEVTKAYYLGLDDDKQDAFLEKAYAAQDEEAAEDKKTKDKKKFEDEAAKTGKTVEVLELQKKVDDQHVEIESLKADRVERDLEKRASTEFAGYPGGNEKVIPLLKAYAKLSDDDRKASEDVLKAQCKVAASAMAVFGARNEAYASKAETAQARIDGEITKRMQADSKLTKADAYEQVVEDPAFADDVAAIG